MSKLECYIIEILIALRLGGQFFVQLFSVAVTGSVDEETIITRMYRLLLIVGTFLATYIVVKRKLYLYIRKQHIWFLVFLLFYVGLMYYYLFIDNTRTYHGSDASAKFSIVINNVLFLSIVAIAFISAKINSYLICKIIVVLSFVSSYLYLSVFGINFGESYDGFLLQDSGFSSLQVGYYCGMSLLLVFYSYKKWSSNTNINKVLTIVFSITFLYMVVVSGKTGPTIFTFFVALVAIKPMFLSNIKMSRFIALLCFLLLLCVVFFDQILSLIEMFNPNLSIKISNTFLRGDTSNRDFLFAEAMNVFNDNIFFGSYFELKRYDIYPHNFFLENLITWGIFGTACMCVFLWKAYKVSIKLIQQNSQLIWVCYLFFFSFLSAQSTGSLYGNYRFWISLTILITISNMKYEYGKSVSKCYHSNLFTSR